MAPVQSRLRKTIRDFLYVPAIKKSIEMMPVVRKIYPPVQRTHPFDRLHGIDTSGFVGVEKIHHDKNLIPLINPYGGSQPSIVRAGLAALGDVREHIFIDLGCGKGRAITVASEFPFREIVGIELSADLAKTARANAATIAAKFPQRPRVTITEGNVVDVPLPPGKLVFFSYHAFGPELIAQMMKRFEAALEGETPHIFFVYYNPVHPEAFDASPAFSRFFVRQIPYDASEIGFGPERDDVVAIWQSKRGAVTPHERTDRKLIVTKPLFQAGLAD